MQKKVLSSTCVKQFVSGHQEVASLTLSELAEHLVDLFGCSNAALRLEVIGLLDKTKITGDSIEDIFRSMVMQLPKILVGEDLLLIVSACSIMTLFEYTLMVTAPCGRPVQPFPESLLMSETGFRSSLVIDTKTSRVSIYEVPKRPDLTMYSQRMDGLVRGLARSGSYMADLTDLFLHFDALEHGASHAVRTHLCTLLPPLKKGLMTLKSTVATKRDFDRAWKAFQPISHKDPEIVLIKELSCLVRRQLQQPFIPTLAPIPEGVADKPTAKRPVLKPLN